MNFQSQSPRVSCRASQGTFQLTWLLPSPASAFAARTVSSPREVRSYTGPCRLALPQRCVLKTAGQHGRWIPSTVPPGPGTPVGMVEPLVPPQRRVHLQAGSVHRRLRPWAPARWGEFSETLGDRIGAAQGMAGAATSPLTPSPMPSPRSEEGPALWDGQWPIHWRQRPRPPSHPSMT